MKDVIIILGAGIKQDGSLSDISKERVDYGVELFKKNTSKKIIMSGNYSFWLDHTKQIPIISEAEAMKEYAKSLGVLDEEIIIEKSSKDTIGNAYFTKVDVLEKNNWRNIIVLTSDFHINRTKFVFDMVLGKDYEIEYILVPHDYMLTEKIEIEAKEILTIEFLKFIFRDIEAGDTKKIKDILFKKHPGYAKDSEISFEQLKKMLS